MMFLLYSGMILALALALIALVAIAESSGYRPDPLAWPVARLLLLPVAHGLVVLRRLGGRLMAHTVRYPMEGSRPSTQRLMDRAFRLGDTLESLPTRWHHTARVLGLVCDRHFEAAPGWWDFEVDCAGHDCRACYTCEPSLVGRRWPFGWEPPFNLAAQED